MTKYSHDGHVSGSLNEYDGYYDECRTPENSTHRGASLPPTPSTTPKLLARIAGHTKPSVSLPPTPGRQLPKPNLNHRNTRANRRANIMKRTSSAEYNDPADENHEEPYYYMRPGAISANQMYNEDYNYAYQSIDNLPQNEPEVVTPIVSVVDRTSVVTNVINGTTPTVVTSTYQSQEDYYYNAQDSYQDTEEYYEPKPQPTTRKKKLGRRENSPLLQQNTDSLESRDDELKDSFDTAVSSISSLPQRQIPYLPPVVNTAITAPSIDLNKPVSTATTVTTMPYYRDQTETPKAIVTVNGNVTVRNDINNTTSINTIASFSNTNTTLTNTVQPPVLTRNNSRLLKQQDSIDRGYFNHQDSIDQSEYDQQESYLNNQNYVKTDATESYLTHQESIDSYNDETATLTNGMAEEYGKTGKESPASVIHVETFEPSPIAQEDNQNLQNLQNQNSLMDPYHPNNPTMQNRQDPYAPRRPSVDPYRPLSPTRRTSSDSYTMQGSRKNSLVDQYGNQRTNSNLDPYPVPMSRRTSVRHSPNQEMLKQDSLDQGTPPESLGEHDPEKKSVSFEEEEEHKTERRVITAKQRWHWAYNKIIMQLNVSTILFVEYLYCLCKVMRDNLAFGCVFYVY